LLIPDIREKLEKKYGEDIVKKGSSLLMYGPPGCGKSLTAEAIAYGLKHRCLTCNTVNCNTHQDTLENRLGEVRFLEVEGQAISSKFKGEASDRFDSVFEKVYELAEDDGFVVLFFDEAQVLLSDNADAESDTDAEVTNTFLRRTEGNEIEDKNILIIGATNYPYQIDKAALDRFKFEIFVGPPKESDKLAELWREFTSGQQNVDQLNYDLLGEASVGFAPRELRNLQIQRVDKTYSGKEFDPNNLPSLTHDHYLEYIEESNPKTINRYLGELANNRRKLSGWDKLEEFYEEWRPFLESGSESVDTSVGDDASGGQRTSSAVGADDSANTQV
jgi:transitional endoplasmic reticulum ATPase